MKFIQASNNEIQAPRHCIKHGFVAKGRIKTNVAVIIIQGMRFMKDR